MTKQQAYELAEAENKSPENFSYYEIKNRSMEIYAAAFAEWTQESGLLLRNGNKFWFCIRTKLGTDYTTADLIIKFENQQ